MNKNCSEMNGPFDKGEGLNIEWKFQIGTAEQLQEEANTFML